MLASLKQSLRRLEEEMLKRLLDIEREREMDEHNCSALSNGRRDVWSRRSGPSTLLSQTAFLERAGAAFGRPHHSQGVPGALAGCAVGRLFHSLDHRLIILGVIVGIFNVYLSCEH